MKREVAEQLSELFQNLKNGMKKVIFRAEKKGNFVTKTFRNRKSERNKAQLIHPASSFCLLFQNFIWFWAVVDDCVYKKFYFHLVPRVTAGDVLFSCTSFLKETHKQTTVLISFSDWTNSLLFSFSSSSSYDLIHLLVRTESWLSCLCFFLIYNIKEQSNKYIWNRRNRVAFVLH